MGINERYEQNPQLFGEFPSAIVAELARMLPVGGRVLDVGAGQGRNALALAQKGMRVDALDHAEKGLEQMSAQAAERKIGGIQSRVGRIEQVALSPESYEAMCFINVLHFLPFTTALEVIQKCKDATKPGGMHAISIFTDGTSDFVKTWGARLWSVEELRAAYEGWSIESCESVPGYLVQRNAQGEREPSCTIQFLAKKPESI